MVCQSYTAKILLSPYTNQQQPPENTWIWFKCKFAFAALWKCVCCRNHPSSCIQDPNSFESRFQFLFTCSCQFSISCRASALVACTTSSRRPLEKVCRLLRRSILGLLKSGHEHLHRPPKSSYPDLPSPKDWEQTPACSINLSGAEPIGFHFRTNLITHGFIALLYRQI